MVEDSDQSDPLTKTVRYSGVTAAPNRQSSLAIKPGMHNTIPGCIVLLCDLPFFDNLTLHFPAETSRLLMGFLI